MADMSITEVIEDVASARLGKDVRAAMEAGFTYVSGLLDTVGTLASTEGVQQLGDELSTVETLLTQLRTIVSGMLPTVKALQAVPDFPDADGDGAMEFITGEEGATTYTREAALIAEFVSSAYTDWFAFLDAKGLYTFTGYPDTDKDGSITENDTVIIEAFAASVSQGKYENSSDGWAQFYTDTFA